MVSAQSIVVVAPEQVAGDLANGDTVILNLANGIYYGLNSVGGCIWRFIQQPRAVGEITSMLRQEYNVDPERCDREVLALLEDLASHKLIEIRNGQPE